VPSPGSCFQGTLSSRSVPLQSPFVSVPPAPAHRPSPPERGRRLRKRDPPLVSFLLPEHLYPGCPFSTALPRGSSVEARAATPSPVPSSGFLPSRRFSLRSWTVRARESPSCSTPPLGFAALFHAARVPGASSLQSFPLSRSRTRSREPSCSLAGSRSTTADAVRVSPLPRFRRRADPLPRSTLGCTGRMGQDDGFPRC